MAKTSSSDSGSAAGPSASASQSVKEKHSAQDASNSEREKKKQNFVVRTIWTLVMIAGFFFILGAGHIWVIGLVALIQILTFKEVIGLASEPAREMNLSGSRNLNWYFLATTIYFLEGENVIHFLRNVVLKRNTAVIESFLVPLAIHHRFLSYCLYILGFVYFVATLQKNHYKFQFTQFCVTHMTLFMVVIQAHFIVSNIFAGLFWFIVPCALVISNDIFAYLCGMTFGRHPLIAISPKKTVEGFVGALICTIVLGVVLSHFLAQQKYLICPMGDLGVNAFTRTVDCVPDPVFVPQKYAVPELLQSVLHCKTVALAPVHFHVIFLSIFASLIAPFGGFFASGLKRTFQKKDFGDTIPGHGGITDRMDCQFLMGFFSYLYYETFISTHQVNAAFVLQQALTSLSVEDQLRLYNALQLSLGHRGLLPSVEGL